LLSDVYILDGKLDCNGLARDEWGRALFLSFLRPGDGALPETIHSKAHTDSLIAAFTASDALVVAELTHLNYPIPGVKMDRDDNLPSGHLRPLDLIISSPNARWIPNMSEDGLLVCARIDGSFYTADFTKVPQIYFQGTYYLPYILCRPPPELLAGHAYRLMWYKLDRSKDFVVETGSGNDALGRVRKDLIRELNVLRKELSAKIKILRYQFAERAHQFRELTYCETGMTFDWCALDCAPQTYTLTLLTFASFQRHFLEALACYDYFADWSLRPATDEPRDVDLSVMGAITPHIEEAIRFYMQGVPVWLIRPPSQFPKDANIGERCAPSLPDHMEKQRLPETIPIYKEGPSAFRNRACQGLRAHSIRLGHAAYSVPQHEQCMYDYQRLHIIVLTSAYSSGPRPFLSPSSGNVFSATGFTNTSSSSTQDHLEARVSRGEFLASSLYKLHT